jgi:hypothetical protein
MVNVTLKQVPVACTSLNDCVIRPLMPLASVVRIALGIHDYTDGVSRLIPNLG